MDNVSIEIETSEKNLEFYFSDSNRFVAGKEYPIEGGATIVFSPVLITKSFPAPLLSVVNFLISHLDDISTAIVAHWLYEKLKNKKGSIKSIKINKREVHIDEGEIKKIIEEEITINKK